MNINDLTIGQAKELAAMFASAQPAAPSIDCKMIGKFVIVRCRDAGVHAGYLESYNGRECVLTESRRMWYWKPADGQKFLSGLAIAGAHEDSKIGVALPRIFLTENCEIIECRDSAVTRLPGFSANPQRMRRLRPGSLVTGESERQTSSKRSKPDANLGNILCKTQSHLIFCH